jgi:hypothetical protein
MTELRDLQQVFAQALAGGGHAAVEPLIVGHGLSAAARTGIYENNVRTTFRNTMQIGFPATARLVGTEYFRQLVEAYQDLYPSRSGNLQHVGADFAAFLAQRFDSSSFEYLTDVAAIEWAYQEILVAPEPLPLDVGALGTIPEADYDALRLRLHPAARLLRSRFPLARIWRANREETLDATPIDLGAGGDQLLLLRRSLDVEIHRLDAADYAFLDALAGGSTLVDALDTAANADAQADPAPMLGRYVALGVIVGFAVAACPRRRDAGIEPKIEPPGDDPLRAAADHAVLHRHVTAS